MEHNQQRVPSDHQDPYLTPGAQFEEQPDLQISDEFLQQLTAAQEQDLDFNFDYDSLIAQNATPASWNGPLSSSASPAPLRDDEDPTGFSNGDAFGPSVPTSNGVEASSSIPLGEADTIDNEPTTKTAEDEDRAKRLKTGGTSTSTAQDHKYDRQAYEKAYLTLMFSGANMWDFRYHDKLPGIKRKRGGLEIQASPKMAQAPPMQHPDRPHPGAKDTSPRRTKVPRSRQATTDKPSQKLAGIRAYGAFPASATTLAAARSSCYGTQIYRWQPTDHSVPTSDAEIQACAQRLYNAVVDMAVIQLPLGRSRQGHRLILSMDYSEEYIAWRCFEVVQCAIDLHRYGCMTPKYADRGYNVTTGKQLFDTHHRGSVENPASYRDLTFNQRMDDIVQDLTINKILCQEVLDGMADLNYAIVLAPGRAVEVKMQNGNNNGDRDRRTVAQRQEIAALKVQTQILQQQLTATQQPAAVPAALTAGVSSAPSDLAPASNADRPVLAPNPSAANIPPRSRKGLKRRQTRKSVGHPQNADKPATNKPTPMKAAQRYTLLEQPSQVGPSSVAPEYDGAITQDENVLTSIAHDSNAHQIIAETADVQQEQVNHETEYNKDDSPANWSNGDYEMNQATFDPTGMVDSSANQVTMETPGIQHGQVDIEGGYGYGDYEAGWANSKHGMNKEPSESADLPDQRPGFALLPSSGWQADGYDHGMYHGSWLVENPNMNQPSSEPTEFAPQPEQQPNGAPLPSFNTQGEQYDADEWQSYG